MGIIGRMREAGRVLAGRDPIQASGGLPNESDDFWFGPAVYNSWSGVHVTPETALRAAAVYACVKIISEDVASLPLGIFRRLANGGSERDRNHPIDELLSTRPNAWQTAVEFREFLMFDVLLRGNAYAEIVPGRRGFANSLEPLFADRVTPRRIENGEVRYEVRPAVGGMRVLNQAEVLHLRGYGPTGIVGFAPIEQAKDIVGLAIATERHGSLLFKNMAVPSGVLEHPGEVSEKAAKRLKDSWMKAQGGTNQLSTAILEEGMKYNVITMNSKEAQFIELRKFQVLEVARFFRVPPDMIMDFERSTFSNAVEQARRYVTYTLRPWLVRFEAVITRDLILAPQTFFPRHNVDALLRGDLKARYEAYALGLLNGFLSINEVRALEPQLNPIALGDQHRVPMNTEPLGGQGQGQAQAMRSVFDAAAQRVARAEIRGLLKLDGGADDYFLRLGAFYERHAVFAERVLEPVLSAMNVADVSGLVKLHITASTAWSLPADALAAMEAEWAELRAEELLERAIAASAKED